MSRDLIVKSVYMWKVSQNTFRSGALARIRRKSGRIEKRIKWFPSEGSIDRKELKEYNNKGSLTFLLSSTPQVTMK